MIPTTLAALATLAAPATRSISTVARRDTTPAAVVVTIQATVTDSLKHPIAGAAVRLDSAAWVPVRADGHAEFSGVGAGRHILEARAVGYGARGFAVSLAVSGVVAVPIVLAPAVVLSPLEVKAQADAAPPLPAALDWRQGFAERRAKNSGGTYIDQREIDRRNPPHFTDLLRGVPGVMFRPVPNGFGGYDQMLVMRGIATVHGGCPIQYYVDGHPYEQTDDIDRMVSPREVAAIEVYPGASQVPPQFKGPSAACGVIVIWTR